MTIALRLPLLVTPHLYPENANYPLVYPTLYFNEGVQLINIVSTSKSFYNFIEIMFLQYQLNLSTTALLTAPSHLPVNANSYNL